MSFQNKCKICRSGKAEEIEFVRYYLRWRYDIIINMYADEIDNLNGYNLSNHFNFHANRAKAKFWRSLRDEIGIYELTTEESEEMFNRIALGLGSSK